MKEYLYTDIRISINRKKIAIEEINVVSRRT